MDVFPSFWRLEGRTVIVVGGGDAAVRKLRLLARTPARIAVYSATPLDEIQALADAGRVSLTHTPVTQGAIAEDVAFAVVATNDDKEAIDAVAVLRSHHIPVNAVDRTEFCDFLIPSIVDRNPVVIGIATGGAAPILARSVRETLEAVLPARLGALAAFAKRFRSAVAATLPDGKTRKAFWESFFAGPIARQILDGDDTAATEAMLARLNGRSATARPNGTITLVEADATAVDLLSLRALRRMQQADVILHPTGIAAEILELSRRDADRESWADTDDALNRAERHAADGLSVVLLSDRNTLPETGYETLRHGAAAAPGRPAARAAIRVS